MYQVDTKKDGLCFTFEEKNDALEYAKKNNIDYIVNTSNNNKIDVSRYNFIRYYSVYIKNNNDAKNIFGSENIEDIKEYLKLKNIKSMYKYIIDNIEDAENIQKNIFIIKDYYIKD